MYLLFQDNLIRMGLCSRSLLLQICTCFFKNRFIIGFFFLRGNLYGFSLFSYLFLNFQLFLLFALGLFFFSLRDDPLLCFLFFTLSSLFYFGNDLNFFLGLGITFGGLF